MMPIDLERGRNYTSRSITVRDFGYIGFESKRLNSLVEELGPAPNGYWVWIESSWGNMGKNIRYVFHVDQAAEYDPTTTIERMFDINNIYISKEQLAHRKWEKVNMSRSGPVPESSQVAHGGGNGRYSGQTSENSHIWAPAGLHKNGHNQYVVTSWLDISSLAYREMLSSGDDPDSDEIKITVQVVKMGKFQAAINKESI